MKAMVSARYTENSAVQSPYVNFVSLAERLHKSIVEVIRDHFVRNGCEDVAPTHALIIYRISAHGALTSELRSRTGKTGNNVSYTLKKLVDKGYIIHQKCSVDRRSIKIYLTPKGREIKALIDSVFEKHLANLKDVAGVSTEELTSAVAVMKKMDAFWLDSVLYKL